MLKKLAAQAILALFLFSWCSFVVGQSIIGSGITGDNVHAGPPPPPPTNSYTFVETKCTYFNNGLFYYTFSENIGTLSATKLVIVGATFQYGYAIASVTVGSASLAKVAGTPGAELWAGTVSSLSGVQTITVNWGQNTSYLEGCIILWTADGLNSNTARTSQAGAPPLGGFNVIAGDFLFVMGINTVGGTEVWKGTGYTTTPAPTVHNSNQTNGVVGADWTTPTNPSFLVRTGNGAAGSGTNPVAGATWR